MLQIFRGIGKLLSRSGEQDFLCPEEKDLLIPDEIKMLRRIVTAASTGPPSVLSAARLADCQQFTDSAIALFRSEHIPKQGLRREGNVWVTQPAHRSFHRARYRFGKACELGGLSVPATLYNLGVCYYHWNIWMIGQKVIKIAIEIGRRYPQTADSSRVVECGDFFIAFVTDFGPTWLNSREPVDPRLFLSSNPHDFLPGRQKFDPDILV
jgi:hypothetical protein